jgi:hydrogenase expression/formation protein HypD
MAVTQLENGIATVENQYARVVQNHGNPSAQKTMQTVFNVVDRDWRGIGMIPSSGYAVSSDFNAFDARKKFEFTESIIKDNTECIAGVIMKGLKKPMDCPHFSKACTPEHPMGAPMVSSEGACAAYYHYYNTKTNV